MSISGKFVFWFLERTSNWWLWGPVARWLEARLLGVVTGRGFRFYPSRQALDRHKSLRKRLLEVEEVWAYPIKGQNLLAKGLNPDDRQKVTRLLLPEPGSGSLEAYELSVNQKGEFANAIREQTRIARDRGIDVRHYSEFLGYSMLFLDPTLNDARVHVEFVLPYSNRNDRPSISIEKKRNEAAYLYFLKAFEDIWRHSNGAG